MSGAEPRHVSVEHEVTSADTAAALGSGDVDVLGTPKVLALAEAATVALLRDRLPDGRTSVGLRVELEHLAPTRVGESVRVTARLTESDERRATFAIEVRDRGDAVVARGTIVRAIVARARFA